MLRALIFWIAVAGAWVSIIWAFLYDRYGR